MGFSSCEYVHPWFHFVDYVSGFTEMASKDLQDWESEEILNFKENYFSPHPVFPTFQTKLPLLIAEGKSLIQSWILLSELGDPWELVHQYPPIDPN